MIRPTAVEPREGHRIRLRYSNGASGEVDLSHLTGRGVFEAWNRPACFESIRITSEGAIAWGEAIELCPGAIYMRLTGRRVEEMMPGVQDLLADA